MDTKPNGKETVDSQPLNNASPARTSTSQLAGNGEVKESKPGDYNFPNSRRTYVAGVLHPDLRVPFREISLAPTKTMSGEIEVNEPVRVYDTSGPWGDNSASPARTVTLDPVQGLPPLRQNWISKRGDVEEIEGRKVQPIDDGYLSEKHARLGGATSPKALSASPARTSTSQIAGNV
jgi:hypothetical protein